MEQSAVKDVSAELCVTAGNGHKWDMTRIINDLGSETGIAESMTRRNSDHEEPRKKVLKRGSGSEADPLGPNSQIGRKLRQYYDELVTEDIPDRFSQLLNELEGKEKS